MQIVGGTLRVDAPQIKVSFLTKSKKAIIRVRMGIKKCVPRDHLLSSLGKPRDAKR